MSSAHTLHSIPYCGIIKFYSWKERTCTVILTQKGPLEFTHSFIQQIFIECLLCARHHCVRHQRYSHENYRHVSCSVQFTGERTHNWKVELYLTHAKNRKIGCAEFWSPLLHPIGEGRIPTIGLWRWLKTWHTIRNGWDLQQFSSHRYSQPRGRHCMPRRDTWDHSGTEWTSEGHRRWVL